ncbi:methyl-accepting chemotaxis protein [Photobacterium indicum]|jgi:methyl-accepting chemotaxis protein|uniref:Methyl-accepting chemotaxis protein n=1 Tax=Photobacterium indicum TaxID=81447 RepID=A0A2T3L4P4_9GAMM|nr:methyl-accepting chemotaxis protein [Photobacterium indicum]PSV44477.1 hypothetical protein C9J47_20270 [Photobacterium indicum]
MKLRHQLIGGFGVCLVLLLLLATSSFYKLSVTLDGFTEYRNLAIASVTSGEIQSNILETRLAASKYIRKQSPELEGVIHENIGELKSLVGGVIDLPQYSGLRDKFLKIENSAIKYNDGFLRIDTLLKDGTEIVNDILDPNGLIMQESLTDITRTARDDLDFEAGYYSGLLQESTLLSRLYIMKFLDSNSSNDEKRVLLEFSSMKKRLKTLTDKIENPKRVALLNRYERSLYLYQSAFLDLSKTIKERNKVNYEVLNKVGDDTAASIEKIEEDTSSRQNIIGPQLQSEISNAKILLSLLSVIAVVASLASAVYIYRSIMRVVGGEPSEIADMVKMVSEGDLKTELSMTGNETGIYANILNMHHELRRILSGLHSVSENVSSASSELSAVMNESKANSEMELTQVELVATAISELSSTANEVSINASNAETAANTANVNVDDGKTALVESDRISNEIASSIQESTQIVSQLRDFSTEIGTVVDVINGISEQTNLLALNAAIEAARAGEQGRGFAVVADEVRSLAAKTQQSTVDIQGLISRLQEQALKADQFMGNNTVLITEAFTINEKLSNTFETISHSVSEISDLNTLVATASEEQSGVTQDISQNIVSTSDMVHQNVAGIAQSSQASEELARLSEEQKALLSYFRI